MVITLTGENSFGWQDSLNHITSDFIRSNGELALERIDGEDADFEALRASLSSPPFLASKKMVVLREPSKNKPFTEEFEQILAGVPETTDVILVEPKLDKRLSYYKFLKSKTDFKEFNELDTNGLARWLVDTAKSHKGTLSLPDARYLVERVGTRQQLLAHELEKLLLYDSKITRDSINALTDPTPQSTIFQLLEAAFAGDSKKTLDLYAEQRALKVEPPQIVAMLAWQLNVLAIVKAAGDRSPDQIAREARLNPFVVRKSQNIARNHSLAELKKLIANLLEIDIKSKSSGIDADEALQTYLVNLAISS